MIKSLRLLVVLGMISLPLAAADWPAAELSAGPSVLRIAKQELLGGRVGIGWNRWEHVSLVGSFGYHGGNEKIFRSDSKKHPPGRCDDHPAHPSDHDQDYDNACPLPESRPVFTTTGIGDVYTYLGGLRVRKKLLARMAGFAQAQVGGARVGDANGFGLAAGGGAQFSITQRFAVEARVEYLRLRIAGSYLGNNLQATVGIVVRFGPWWGGFRKP